MRQSFFIYYNYFGYLKEEIKIAEIGTYEGKNALSILGSCSKVHMTIIDSYESYSDKFTKENGKQFSSIEAEEFIIQLNKRLSKFKDRYSMVREDSLYAASLFPDAFFDYVYIDGSHDYQSVCDDIKAWYPKVKRIGVLGGHDIWNPDVKQALLDYCNPRELTFFATLGFGPDKPLPCDIGETLDWWIWKFNESRTEIPRRTIKE